QSVLVISAIIIITVFAIHKVAEVNSIAALASKVTGTTNWASSSLEWKVKMPAGYESYQDLTLLVFFYFLRNLFIGISSAGADPKYFGARSERECGTLTFLWTSLMTFRWPMMIGFAVLGIFMTSDLFPDNAKLVQAAALIKTYVPGVTREQWPQVVASIMHSPGSFAPGLISGIKNIFISNWQTKLHLLSFDGTVNTEKMLPAVILYYFPMGIRGLLLVAFVAAAISSFNSRINTTAGYFTNDIYRNYLRPKAKDKELLFISYVFIILLVIIGYILAYNVHSITQIWGWIIMGLGGGLAIPGLLTFYWWRYNGEGFAVGTTVGMIVAILHPVLFPDLVEWQQFLLVSVFSLTAAIIGTFLTSPADENIVRNFYEQTRPFGLWNKYKNRLAKDIRTKMELEHKNNLLAVPFVLGWQITMFLLPMQLIIKSYNDFFVTFGIFAICGCGMYWFWYRNLPPKEFPNKDVLYKAPISENIIVESSICKD
ncbi:MAG: sodium:solute symporter family transporter, partial [Clostridiales bacterium]